MRVGTANIRNNPDMRRTKVRADARGARRAGVVFFQEIAEREDHKDLRLGLGPAYEVSHDDVAIPIAWRTKHWQLATPEEIPEKLRLAGYGPKGYIRAHSGKARATPERGITYVFLKKRNRTGRVRKAKIIAFACVHFVSGAWNKKPKFKKNLRKRLWNVHYLVLRDFLADLYDAGITCILGGDFNRKSFPKPHPRLRWMIAGGIDKIGKLVPPGGTRIHFIEAEEYEQNSDHDLKVVTARAVA